MVFIYVIEGAVSYSRAPDTCSLVFLGDIAQPARSHVVLALSIVPLSSLVLDWKERVGLVSFSARLFGNYTKVL